MDYKTAKKNMGKIRRAMGLKGEGNPGDITMGAKKIFNTPDRKVLGSPHTKRGLAKRGLI